MVDKQTLLDWIDELKIAEVFETLDGMGAKSVEYQNLKQVFIFGNVDHLFYQKLKIWIGIFFDQEEAKKQPPVSGTTPKDNPRKTLLVEGVEFEFVWVEGGTFQMGYLPDRDGAYFDWLSHSLPCKTKNVANFWIGKTLVSQEQWSKILGNNPSKFKGGNLPVENISWHDCQAFLQQFNARTAQSFRLPTEEEWEYAARGGNRSQNFTYSGSNQLHEVAWYKGNVNQPKPLCTKKANELGLYDMSGNLWEWTRSGWSENYESPRTSDKYVVRGGAWFNDHDDSRIVVRSTFEPNYKDDGRGVRLAISNLV